MSLKLFHILFITLSVGLTFVLAVWAGRQGSWLLAAGAIAAGAGLVVYRDVFLKKARELGLR